MQIYEKETSSVIHLSFIHFPIVFHMKKSFATARRPRDFQGLNLRPFTA